MAAEHMATDFPVTHCRACDREVPCYLDLDAADQEIARCLECSTPADPTAVRWLDLADLEALGYGFVLPPAGCGRPDCGNGRCGRAAPDDEG
jgi:hypothetical protein